VVSLVVVITEITHTVIMEPILGILMNRIMKRPMFRKGGSAGEGITSGLAPRQGYQEAGRCTKPFRFKNIRATPQQLREASKTMVSKHPLWHLTIH
jgi:hypothetical protein